jgi:hypothetical protein
VADLVPDLRRVSHRVLAVDGVLVAAPDAGRLHVARVDELGEDALGRTFGDPDAFGHVTQPDVGRVGKAEENLGVVGEERELTPEFDQRRAASPPVPILAAHAG